MEAPLKGLAVGGQKDQDISTADFDAFFARHEHALYGYLRRLLPSDEVAVEIAQETFFRAWIHFAKIQHYDRPHAWLYRVATNLALGVLRRHQPTPISQIFNRQRTGEESGEFQDDASTRRNEEIGKVQRYLVTEIQGYATAQGYDLVLGDGVFYAKGPLDITANVLAVLATKPASLPATAPSPAKTPATSTPPAKNPGSK